MLESFDDLLLAGVDLLTHSGLVSFDKGSFEFRAQSRESFEEFHEKRYDRSGRLVCWILFSTGAEYVVKAVYHAHEVAPPKPASFDAGYTNGSRSWLVYGPLGQYASGHRPLFDDALHLEEEDRDIHKKGLNYLKTIRNRDVHSYIKGVRNENHPLVEDVFVPMLNLLLGTLPKDVQARLADDSG
jgi:hypothetical protein